VTYVDTDQGAVGYGGEEFRMSPFGLGVFLERDPTVSTSTSFGGCMLFVIVASWRIPCVMMM